jgi:hypothetical protein
MYLLCPLHALSGDRPNTRIEVELVPLRADDFAHPLDAERDKGVGALHASTHVTLIGRAHDGTHSFAIQYGRKC